MARGLPPSKLCRLGHELLPQLDPDNPRMLVAAFPRESTEIPPHDAVRRLLTALQLAERRRSDFSVAMGGYLLASWLHLGGGAVVEGLPPSTALGAVRKAAAAFKRCKGLLPKVWVAHLEEYRSSAIPGIPWLEQLTQQGDSWLPVEPAEKARRAQGAFTSMFERRDQEFEVHRCSGCGKVSGQLKVCTGCSRAKYCR